MSEPRLNLMSHSPHMREIGVHLVAMEGGVATVRVPYAEHLVGNPDTGVLHGGVLTAVLDSVSGMAIHSALERPMMIATLDLRIDYMKPATPERELFARAECYKLTRSVAFVRGTAYHDTPEEPIATTVATFMLASDQTRNLGSGS